MPEKTGNLPTPARTVWTRNVSTRAVLGCSARLRSILFVCVLSSTPHAAEGWTEVATDDASTMSMRVDPAAAADPASVRLQVRVVYRKPRDMMGLAFDGSTTDYLLSCGSREILRKQQMLFNGEERVWTFPESASVVKVATEIAPEVERRACAR